MQLAITPHTAFRLAHAHAQSTVPQLVAATQALAASLGIPMEELCVLCSKVGAGLHCVLAHGALSAGY
jgi:hypothetical protein